MHKNIYAISNVDEGEKRAEKVRKTEKRQFNNFAKSL